MRRRGRRLRWVCICTFPFAASAASSAISASTPTRTPATSTPTSTPWCAKSAYMRKRRSSRGRPLQFRLFRRRHAVVSQRHATARSLRKNAGALPLEERRGSDFRMRAGHACSNTSWKRSRNSASPGSAWASRTSTIRSWKRMAGPICRPRFFAPTPGHAQLEFPADQHRSHRRHGRRDLGQLA